MEYIHPPDNEESHIPYPVVYHLHGWAGNESSGLWAMEAIYRGRRAVTVFPNSSPVIGEHDNLPVEAMLIKELIPLIEREYRTVPIREYRSPSGFSIGGEMAFVYAINHLDLFSSVRLHAGTYHHYYHEGSKAVGVPFEKALELYEDMINDKKDFKDGNVLFCDNEILHLHLDALCIPHDYKIFAGAGHDLKKIL